MSRSARPPGTGLTACRAIARLDDRDRLPRPRGDHADAARGRGGDGRGAVRWRATPRRCTPPAVRARRGGRGGARADRARRSAPGPARSSSPPAAPRPTTSRSRACSGPAGRQDPRRRRIVASAVEHHAVLDPVEWLAEHEGAVVDWLPVDRCGRVDVDALRDGAGATRSPSPLVSVMWANNEVGTVQPVARARGRRPRARRPGPHRRRAGRRPPRRSTSTSLGARLHDGQRPQDRRAGRRRRRSSPGATLRPRARRPRWRAGAAGARRHPRRGRRSAPSPSPRRSPSRDRATSTPARRRRCATASWRAVLGRGAGRGAARRPGPGPAARQRAPHVPGCEGDSLLYLLDAARRRVLHRVGLPGRRAAAEPRAARDGGARGGGPRRAAVLARPHLDRGRRRRRRRRRSARSSSVPGGPEWRLRL